MTKEDALAAIKLLSALESWAMSQQARLPDYLHEDLCIAVEKLEKIMTGFRELNVDYQRTRTLALKAQGEIRDLKHKLGEKT